MKFRRWVIINRNNLIDKHVVTSLTELLLKSSFGNYLKVEGIEINSNANVIDDKSTFVIHKANTLPLPEWVILRANSTSIHLDP